MTEVHSMPASRLGKASARLLEPNEIDFRSIAKTLTQMRGGGVDFADLFFETTVRETWRLEDQKVTSGSYAVSQGVGARAVAGEQATLAYSSEISSAALTSASRGAREMSGVGSQPAQAGSATFFRRSPERAALYQDNTDDLRLSPESKIAFLQSLDGRVRASDPLVRSVNALLRITETIVLIAGSDGTLEADIRPLLQLNLWVVAERNGKIARGTAGLGGRYGLDGLTEARLSRQVQRAVTTALANLDARPAPAGVMPVVLGSGFPGILLHEAIGHGLEGDAHRKRSSVFTERMGAAIAASGVTVVDDGSIPGLAGSQHIDDEGTPSQRTVLIDDGKLTGLMQDKLNARLMNASSSGNARRESYSVLPMPRMTNTYLEPGDRDPQEIIATVSQGIYAVEFGGGTVDVTSGRFNFSATKAFLIEDGKITAPLSGATLIGVGHEALKRITLIGNDLAFDEGEAVCSKNGQNLFVGVGQPTIKIDEMVVGGQG